MQICEIADKLRTSEYQFLREDERLANRLIFLTLGGSYAYGTNNENSDIDIRGCALNSKSEILLARDFETVTNDATDTVIYSFNKLIALLTSCNPNTIELLGGRPDSYFVLSDVGKELLKNRDMFLSRKCIKSFGGYANAQLWRLNNKANRLVSQSEQEEHILKTLTHAGETWREQFFEYPDDAVRLYIDKAVNEAYDTEIFMDINLRHYPLRDYKSLWQSMNNIVKEYNKIGSRNSKAIQHDKLAKHMMHLVRLYFMCFDILEKGEINTYRENDREFLLEIRNGKYLDDLMQPTEEFFEYLRYLENRLQYDAENTSLPDTPDYDRINEFKMCVNEMIVNGKEQI